MQELRNKTIFHGHRTLDRCFTYWNGMVTFHLQLRAFMEKPFVLLSVMDLMAEGVIAENFIEPSLELLNTFNRY